ncbi:MAG: DUF3054 domain-containing protein [Candidatus Microbacterium stercoravium]
MPSRYRLPAAVSLGAGPGRYRGRMRRFPWILAAAIDLVLIIVFAAIGMANHHGAILPGLVIVAWPFVVGAAIGWLASLAWKAPAKPVRSGLAIWILAVVAGMVLRVATGGGFAWSFFLVTALVLGAFLVGWRAIVALVVRIRAKQRS